jgi:hypothetical protein
VPVVTGNNNTGTAIYPPSFNYTRDLINNRLVNPPALSENSLMINNDNNRPNQTINSIPSNSVISEDRVLVRIYDGQKKLGKFSIRKVCL